MSNILGAGCPVVNKNKKGKIDDNISNATTDTGCRSDDLVNPKNNMLIQEKQTPSVGQNKPLPVNRQESSIPKADFNPQHQEEDKNNWEYPSEQMLFNAMKRKGWKPEEDDMKSVVAIHNAVNETAWRQVMEWENLHEDSKDEVKLKKFCGRPKDTTPKAFLRGLLGQERPFDRHDWVVDRNGEDVRYVVDFYNVRESKEKEPIAVYVDARPALDNATSVFDRVRMGFKRIFSSDPRTMSSAYVPTLITKKNEALQPQPQPQQQSSSTTPTSS
eukprot:m.9093 g.9093  ORF g.9093 m.9093 type:complete len:273 (+) comp3360_c0_seq1:203-1021(+)